MTDQPIYDMLLAIPAEVVHLYFPHNTEEEYQKAAKHLERKLKQFRGNFESRLYPVSGKYILNHFEELCETMPELMCSIVLIGKDDPGYIFPVVQNYAIEITPVWEPLSFEMIIQVERHLQACGRSFLHSMLGPEQKQKVYGDLKRQIENLSGARRYQDIRGIYGLFYAELRLILKGLYTDMEHDWVFEKDLIDNLSTWIALRDDQFFILKLAQRMSGKIKNLEEFDRKATTAIETLKATFESLKTGEPPKLLPYDEDYSKGIPGQVAESSAAPIGRSITDFDTLEIEIPSNLRRGTQIPFRLSKSPKRSPSTELIYLCSTDAAMLYFLGKEREEKGESWLVSPTDHHELLEEIIKVFSDSLEPRLKQELAGHEYPTRNSWVYGSANTRSRCASRIHKALREQAKIQKARGDRHGPMLFPCSTKIHGGGYHLPTIDHFIPPGT